MVEAASIPKKLGAYARFAQGTHGMDVERNTIMDSMISKGERLLPAMFGGHMHRIRLAFSDGELWATPAKSAAVPTVV